MTQYDDPQAEQAIPPAAEVKPVETDAVKVYERPARTTPVWLLALFVLAALATLWFLFTYVF